MRLIVIYDISDDGDRERLARKLLALGLQRVQRSAFVGVGGAALAKDVARAAQPFARGERDSVIVFVVPSSSVRCALVVGKPMAPLEGVVRYALL